MANQKITLPTLTNAFETLGIEVPNNWKEGLDVYHRLLANAI